MQTLCCPCQSGILFTQCCHRYLSGSALPATPEQLMRSRYSAYYLQNDKYLIETWHCDTTDIYLQRQQMIKEGFIDLQWLGLAIIATSYDHCNQQGFVEFMAYYQQTGRKQQTLYERSRFRLMAQRWFYIDGTHLPLSRHAPCPCGSGKKYQRCCQSIPSIDH